jgi:hypothetical protein
VKGVDGRVGDGRLHMEYARLCIAAHYVRRIRHVAEITSYHVSSHHHIARRGEKRRGENEEIPRTSTKYQVLCILASQSPHNINSPNLSSHPISSPSPPRNKKDGGYSSLLIRTHSFRYSGSQGISHPGSQSQVA